MEGWRSWREDLTIRVEHEEQDHPTTTLVGNFDQAALHGLLRSLYSIGLPLISVQCTDFNPGEQQS
jgi:hypothetical protein